ncbi:MAG: hypothetical protein V2I43_01310 [Parvularcula sp.]|jgi:hypothetical protein|nr:hypothetical protein [Parvularcula sp.]
MALLLFLLVTMYLVYLWSQHRSKRPRVRRRSGDVIDAGDRFRQRRTGGDGFAAITAIHDPVTAAATFVRLVIGPDLWPMATGRLKLALAEVSSFRRADDAMRYAEWAAKQRPDRSAALRSLTTLLREQLTLEERQHLLAMLEDAAATGPAEVKARASREGLSLVN